MRRRSLRVLGALVAASILASRAAGAAGAQVKAQTPQAAPALTAAAATITADELARHVAVLAADSLRGRRTPSPGLERAAQYLADEFQRLGLRPGIPAQNNRKRADSTWFQRYPVPGQRRLNFAASQLILRHPDDTSTRAYMSLGSTARFLPEVGPPVVAQPVLDGFGNMFSIDLIHMGGARTTVVSGRQTAASLAPLDVRDQVALYVPPAGADSAEQARVVTALYATAAGVMLVRDGDSAQFAAAARAASQTPVPLVDGYLRDATGPQRWPWAMAVWAGAVAPFLQRAGIDLAALRADATPRAHELLSTGAWLEAATDTAGQASAATVPNVVAFLEGSDSVLRQQCIVVSAHMDGGGPARADSAERGADDNAVGAAALLAVARALSAPGARPKRSVLFVATSGAGGASGARGGQPFWGSSVAASYEQRFKYVPLIVDSTGQTGLTQFVANVTVDRIGRLRGDSVLIQGMEDMNVDVPADWVAASHSELGLRVVDAGTAATPDGDQFAFVRHGVPSLYVHGGRHGVDDGGPDTAAGLDLEAAARAARLVFYVTEELATAARPVRWSEEGRRRFLAVQSQ